MHLISSRSSSELAIGPHLSFLSTSGFFGGLQFPAIVNQEEAEGLEEKSVEKWRLLAIFRLKMHLLEEFNEVDIICPCDMFCLHLYRHLFGRLLFLLTYLIIEIRDKIIKCVSL